MKHHLRVTLLCVASSRAAAWVPTFARPSSTTTALDMAAVGIFFGTSTGNTQSAADAIFEAFGSDVAAEPVDVDTLDEGQVAQAFSEHDALVVGTPTWNTGADTERSGTGWDELYYTKLPELKSALEGKKVAVFGLGDQVSYAENYADATGELFDVFESLGCTMLGSWSQDGYEHEASKSIRGEKFCGLLLDYVNQEELNDERVQTWVAQLKDEGILDGGTTASSIPFSTPSAINGEVAVLESEPLPPLEAKETSDLSRNLDENSSLLDQNIGAHSSGGFTPYHNPVSGRTMWVSQDGRQSYVTTDAPIETKHLTP